MIGAGARDRQPQGHVDGAPEVEELGRDAVTPLRPQAVTISIGVSCTTADSLTLDELVAAADKALYLAKSRGRNRAFGVVGMKQAGDDSLAANLGNLDEAWHSGIVEGTEVLGAPPEVAVPAH